MGFYIVSLMDLSPIIWHPLGYLHAFKPFRRPNYAITTRVTVVALFEPSERGKAIMAIKTRLLAIVQTLSPTLDEGISYSTDNHSSKIVITCFSSRSLWNLWFSCDNDITWPHDMNSSQLKENSTCIGGIVDLWKEDESILIVK